MSFEKSSGNPLVDFFSDIKDQFDNSFLVFFSGILNGFNKEGGERIQRVLIHVFHDT